MNEYQALAEQFLADCNATIEINFIGKEIPSNWQGKTKPHNKYQFTITTPKGKYTNYFFDSLHNTEISEMTLNEYARKIYKANFDVLANYAKAKVRKGLASLKAKAKPTEYDILACLEKYGYDSFSDFCAECGLSTDSISAMKIYLIGGEEYKGLRRIFTKEQMEKLREIY